MTYISIDTNKKQALLFLEYVKTLPFVKVYQEPNKDTLKAMDDAKKGKNKKFKNAKDLIEDIRLGNAMKKTTKDKMYSREEALKFFRSHKVSFKDYKFDREEANAR